jgi:hypothetical protein
MSKSTYRQPSVIDGVFGAAASTVGGLLAGTAAIAFVIAIPAAWLTHLYICFTGGQWGFLVAGAIFFPVGIIHGLGRWVGAW